MNYGTFHRRLAEAGMLDRMPEPLLYLMRAEWKPEPAHGSLAAA
jgi:hypothetical protein